MKRIGLITLVVALLAAGCGDDKPSVKAQGSTATSSVTPDEVIKKAERATGTSLTTTTASGGSGGTTTTARPPSQGGGATTTAPPPDPAVTMTLDRPCVRKGPLGDKQGLTVKTKPGDTVAWSTEYSDRTNEMSNPEYKTGSGYGKADSNGNFHSEWIVPEQAPLGEARLHTIANGRLQPVLPFRVVGPNDSC